MMISFHNRIIGDHQWRKNCALNHHLSFSHSRGWNEAGSFWQTEFVWQASTWLSKGDSRRVLWRLRPFKPPLRTPAFLAQGVCVVVPYSSVVRFVSLPPSLSTALTRSLYLFFFLFFFIQLFPHSMAPVVASFSRALRLAGRVSFLGNAWIERWRCAGARVCGNASRNAGQRSYGTTSEAFPPSRLHRLES